MQTTLERENKRKGWSALVLFLALAVLPTVWVVLRPATQLQALVGTIVASAAIGAVAGYVLLFVALWAYERLSAPTRRAALAALPEEAV